MFRGICVLFGGGLSSARKKIFSNIFTTHGGVVLPTRSKSLKTKVQLDSALDYIIIENTEIKFEKLCGELKCETIDERVEVVDCAWIEKCVLAKALLPPGPYIVEKKKDYIGCTLIDASSDGGISVSGNADGMGEEVKIETMKRSATENSDSYRQRAPSRLKEESDTNRKTKRRRVDPCSQVDGGHRCRTAGIILHFQDKIFMVQPTGSRGFGIPKGGMEVGESAEDAAVREFQEETGIPLHTTTTTTKTTAVSESETAVEQQQSPGALEMVYLRGSGDIRGGKPVHAFMVRGDGSETFHSSNLITEGFRRGLPENSGGRYVSIDEAGQICHKNQKKLIDLYCAHYHEQQK